MVKCSLRDKSAISEDHCFQKTAFPKQTFPGLSLLQNDISLRTLTLLGQPTPVTDRWLVQRPGHLGFLDVITKGPSRIKLCMGSAGPGTGPDSHFILSSSLLQLLSSLLPRYHSWNICWSTSGTLTVSQGLLPGEFIWTNCPPLHSRVQLPESFPQILQKKECTEQWGATVICQNSGLLLESITQLHSWVEMYEMPCLF